MFTTNVTGRPTLRAESGIWTARTAVTLGLVSGLVGAHLIYGDLATQQHYQQLATAGGHSQAQAAGQAPASNAIDWSALKLQNGDIAAWVRVNGTSIDYPVVMPTKAESEFYLAHDFWRHDSPAGCPFLDVRCAADGPHAIVYGHHMGASKAMFSELYDSYRDESFAELGTLLWSTPQSGSLTLEPLCALTVDSSFKTVQRFVFDGTEDLHKWLSDLSSQASTRVSDAVTLIQSATKAVSLVTCSSVVPGRQQRTIVVFVGQETGASQDSAVLAGLPPSGLPNEA